jgi:ABC-type branched-subunit amino acid transport system ATPase component
MTAPAPPPGSPDLVTGPALLDVTGVVKSFGGAPVVNAASCTVAKGSVTGLIGPNGAGKSTLVAIIGGALRADAGQVSFLGQDITHQPVYRRARAGLTRTFQLSSEFARLTVLENLMAAAQGHPGDRFRVLLLGKRSWRQEEERVADRARGLLDRFGMTAKGNDYAGSLSGGQKRIVEIMRALMAEPELLVLDEPLAGINPTLGRTIESYLLDLNREDGLSMLIVEHELGALERLSHTVIVMANGKVIAEGELSDVLARPEVVNAYIVG